ncbi:Non-catalytic module family DOC2 [Piromyces sp. E2]|nr:Non-catalytic module family DOC2 [Piromyces sp. E2]|eukprot:OUM70125.1 Non-catalytic module family DOC2 [Piromyces sp. E2]
MRRCDTYGPIPNSFGNLKNVIYLQLYGNRLNGTIPEELGNMENVEQMLISRNELSGGIPESFGNLKNLKQFGTIPQSLEKLEKLEIFDVSFNNFSGVLPEYLNTLPNLNEVVASFNKELYGYVVENPKVKICDYSNSNICYKEGSIYCKKGAVPCTKELIEKIEALKKESSHGQTEECWAKSLGYSCCTDTNATPYYEDEDGEWGIENNSCEKITKQGYLCCSTATQTIYTDESGDWGVENNQCSKIIAHGGGQTRDLRVA